MRSVLLWMARNERLAETIPNMRFAKRAVRRFMPGERVDDAFAAAERLRDERVRVLFTRLGENITTLEEAQAVADHYRRVLARDGRRQHVVGPVELSIKPTQLGLDQDADACLALCQDIARECATTGTWFWIDMEGSEYTDRTLDLAEALMADLHNVGIAIQTYLMRSAADIERLLPHRQAIRLVKGAYDEQRSMYPQPPCAQGVRAACGHLRRCRALPIPRHQSAPRRLASGPAALRTRQYRSAAQTPSAWQPAVARRPLGGRAGGRARSGPFRHRRPSAGSTRHAGY